MNELDRKRKAILEMFQGWPGLQMSEAKMRMTVTAFLSDTASYSASVLERACIEVRKGGGYAPESGRVCKQCARIAAEDFRARRRMTPRLPLGPRGLSAVPESERAAVKARIEQSLRDFHASVAEFSEK